MGFNEKRERMAGTFFWFGDHRFLTGFKQVTCSIVGFRTPSLHFKSHVFNEQWTRTSSAIRYADWIGPQLQINLQWVLQIRELSTFPYLPRNLVAYIQILCFFDQKPVVIRQKLSHLANLALVRDFQSKNSIFIWLESIKFPYLALLRKNGK